jgi:hypothetical protein
VLRSGERGRSRQYDRAQHVEFGVTTPNVKNRTIFDVWCSDSYSSLTLDAAHKNGERRRPGRPCSGHLGF